MPWRDCCCLVVKEALERPQRLHQQPFGWLIQASKYYSFPVIQHIQHPIHWVLSCPLNLRLLKVCPVCLVLNSIPKRSYRPLCLNWARVFPACPLPRLPLLVDSVACLINRQKMKWLPSKRKSIQVNLFCLVSMKPLHSMNCSSTSRILHGM